MENPFPESEAGSEAGASSSDPSALPEGSTRGKVKPPSAPPFHPVLFAAFPLLALFAHNLGQIPLGQLERPLGKTLLGAAGVWALFALLTRHIRKSALAASALVLVYFSYQHVADVLPPGLRALALPLCGVCLILLLGLALRAAGPLREVTAILNLVSVALLAPSCWTIGAYQWRQAHSGAAGSVTAASQSETPLPISPSRHLVPARPDLPDVYYIILDAYGRADRLRLFYDYDNAPFLDALKQRGFYIAAHSHANYDQTPLCLASALSMNYLDALPQPLTPEILREAVDDSAVAATLRRLGYRYVSIWSGLELSRVMTADAVFNNQPDLTQFEEESQNLTPHLARQQLARDRYERHRERIRGVFDSLEVVARQPAPKFVFAHVLAPHPPFVFGARGEPTDPYGPLTYDDGSELLQHYTRAEYRRNYIAQLQYINRRVLSAVDAILKQSPRRPMIIIQGDHGSRMTIDWESLAHTDLREAFAPLNAYLVPDIVRSALYDTITPVNSFRLLLTRALGANLPLLPDHSYYSTSEQPYDFTDVTGHLNEPPGATVFSGPSHVSAPLPKTRPPQGVIR